MVYEDEQATSGSGGVRPVLAVVVQPRAVGCGCHFTLQNQQPSNNYLQLPTANRPMTVGYFMETLEILDQASLWEVFPPAFHFAISYCWKARAWVDFFSTRSSQEIHLVMEYMAGGELYDRLFKHRVYKEVRSLQSPRSRYGCFGSVEGINNRCFHFIQPATRWWFHWGMYIAFVLTPTSNDIVIPIHEEDLMHGRSSSFGTSWIWQEMAAKTAKQMLLAVGRPRTSELAGRVCF